MLSTKMLSTTSRNMLLGNMRLMSTAGPATTSTLKPLPEKPLVEMAYDVHLPERSVIGKLPYHVQEPVVFVHGLYGSKRNYKTDAKKIATYLQTPVYVVDVRNHGQTEHALPFDYTTLSNDLIHFIKKHELGPVNLIGYSLGAKISMLTMLRNPEMVKAACIIDNSPIVQPEIVPFLKIFTKACVDTLTKANIKATDKSWRHKASENLKKFIPNAGIRGYLLNNVINHKPKGKDYKNPLVNYDDGKIHWKNPIQHMTKVAVDDVAAWPVSATEGKKYLGPVGFIRGTKSDFVRANGLKAINEYFPYNKVIDINATHFILNERPSEYVRDVCDFFKTMRPALIAKRTGDEAHMTDSQVTEKRLHV
ncbi:Ethanol acetyltransferase 1 [Hanseniaspora osmophila]